MDINEDVSNAGEGVWDGEMLAAKLYATSGNTSRKAQDEAVITKLHHNLF